MKNLILVGKSASGKDTLKKIFVDLGFVPENTYTSRLPRFEGENTHNFVSVEYFEKNRNDFAWISVFNNWYYGIKKSQLSGSGKISILPPNAIKTIGKELRKNSIVIFLDPDDDILLERLANRKDNSYPGRFDADKKDFIDFTDWDLTFKHFIIK